jgi:metallo-beta-lactamase family protein
VLAELGPALHRLAGRGGVAVIPVFAVGRAQEILHAIDELKVRGEIPKNLPVFLDSPMAIHTTHLFDNYMDEHRLSSKQVMALTRCATMVNTPDESKALARRHGPMVILAASGMATGGRVLHHLALYAGNHRNMIILTGFQSPGTRGATLASGAPSVRIHGKDVSISAEVVQLQSASAHADAPQLMAWLRSMPTAPSQVYIVHGETGASDALRQQIEHGLGWRALVPEHGATWPT